MADAITTSPLRRLTGVELRRTVAQLFPEVDVSGFALPADTVVHGFENNAKQQAPSPLLVESIETLAQGVAEKVVAANYEQLVTCDPVSDEAACASSSIEAVGSRLFRRPLSGEEVARYAAFFAEQRAATISFRGSFELTLTALLQAPQFLYRVELGAELAPSGALQLTEYELATRLSYLITQAAPDAPLLAAAAAGKLSAPAGREAETRRLLATPVAARAMADYHRQWLHLNDVLSQQKDPTAFPAWSESLREDIHRESLEFVQALFEAGEGTLTSVLTSRKARLNGRMGQLYGVSVSGEEWQSVELAEGERAGLLTRAAFLAGRSRPTNGSPPLRGVRIMEQLLCDPPKPPPAELDTSLPDPSGAPQTNRERFEQKTSQPACFGCHERIDGLGMTFENYDSTGAYRSLDNQLPVDASGRLVKTDVDGEVTDALALSKRLAESKQVKACLALSWYRYSLGRDEDAADWCKVDTLTRSLVESNGDYAELVVALVKSWEFGHRAPQSSTEKP